ncbi:MAG: hypothetical protein ACLQDV_22995 [Candidatus Binataceae bacterium]
MICYPAIIVHDPISYPRVGQQITPEWVFVQRGSVRDLRQVFIHFVEGAVAAQVGQPKRKIPVGCATLALHFELILECRVVP